MISKAKLAEWLAVNELTADQIAIACACSRQTAYNRIAAFERDGMRVYRRPVRLPGAYLTTEAFSMSPHARPWRKWTAGQEADVRRVAAGFSHRHIGVFFLDRKRRLSSVK